MYFTPSLSLSLINLTKLITAYLVNPKIILPEAKRREESRPGRAEQTSLLSLKIDKCVFPADPGVICHKFTQTPVGGVVSANPRANLTHHVLENFSFFFAVSISSCKIR